ncbi:MAG: nucleotide exchange factor GrpE, partial [Blastocatellia bacterium]
SEEPSAITSDSATNDAAEVVDADFALTETPLADAGGQADDQVATAAIAEWTSQINTRFDELGQWLNESNRIATERERIIDRLHQENQQLKGGELQQAMLPLFRDLIRLHDDLQQTAQRYAGQDNAESARDFMSYSEASADILYRYGVERYETVVGTAFNPKEQRALAAIPTTDESLDRMIAKIIRSGFRTESRNIRLLEAEVYRATPVSVQQPVSPEQAEQPKQSQLPTTNTQ